MAPGDGGMRVCVLTGDVVKSTGLDAAVRRRLFDVMKEASSELQGLLGEAVPLGVDIYRGDSWQVLVRSPRLGLRAALFFRSYLRAFVEPKSRSPVDTRVALAIGGVDFIPAARVGEGEGEAFRRSGRMLEGAGSRRLVIDVESGVARLWDLAFRLIDELAIGWTALQARAVNGAIRGLKQEEIGSLWRPAISQPSVASHLRAAHWYAVEPALEEFESTIE